MSFKSRPTADLINIVTAGGGVIIDAAARPTADLINIANAAARSGARVVFRDLEARPTADLINIARAGKGNVQLEGRPNND